MAIQGSRGHPPLVQQQEPPQAQTQMVAPHSGAGGCRAPSPRKPRPAAVRSDARHVVSDADDQRRGAERDDVAQHDAERPGALEADVAR